MKTPTSTIKTTTNDVHVLIDRVSLQVQALFERVESEQGRLDILVNNAFALGPGDQLKAKFWKQGVSEPKEVF